MTDLEKLKELLNGWGVAYKEYDGRLNALEEGSAPPTSPRCIQVGNDNPFDPSIPKVVGYHGFHTVFEFTPEGTFIQMGAWE